MKLSHTDYIACRKVKLNPAYIACVIYTLKDIGKQVIYNINLRCTT